MATSRERERDRSVFSSSLVSVIPSSDEHIRILSSLEESDHVCSSIFSLNRTVRFDRVHSDSSVERHATQRIGARHDQPGERGVDDAHVRNVEVPADHHDCQRTKVEFRSSFLLTLNIVGIRLLDQEDRQLNIQSRAAVPRGIQDSFYNYDQVSEVERVFRYLPIHAAVRLVETNGSCLSNLGDTDLDWKDL